MGIFGNDQNEFRAEADRAYNEFLNKAYAIVDERLDKALKYILNETHEPPGHYNASGYTTTYCYETWVGTIHSKTKCIIEQFIKEKFATVMEDYIGSEEFLDRIVDRIKRKQL